MISQWRRIASSIVGICGITYAVVFVVFNLMSLDMQLPIITSLFLTYVFCQFPFAALREDSTRRKRVLVQAIDIILAVLALTIGWYQLANSRDVIFVRAGMPNLSDIIMGTIAIILVIDSVRRVAGWVLVIIAGTFLFYAFFGYLFPSLISHRGYGLDRVASCVYLGNEGMYGTPIQVIVQYVILFIAMGTILEISGGAQFLIDLAKVVAGRITGGPAMVSVVAAALFGTISGSAVANVVVVGVISIPAMKKYGFESHTAGAIEAYNSTGGQLMPPVMGAAAFLIADVLGVPYAKVAIAAVIPALLYYFACFSAIYVHAKRLGLKGEKRENLPSFYSVVKRGYYLVPIFIIIGLLISGFSPTMAGFVGLLVSVILCFLSRWLKSQYDPRLVLKDLGKGLARAARETSSLVPICTVAGIVIGLISLTGLGPRLSSVLVTIAGGNSFLLLCLVAFVALIMGMGMPTTAVYVVLSVMVVPALMMLKMNAMASHLFVFYFGLLSMITPPVALAAYAAAAIAETNFNKVGWTAFKLAIPCFIIPFAFIYQPVLLLGTGHSFVETIWPATTAGVGVFFLSASIEGYLVKQLASWKRIGMAFGGVLLIVPGIITDVIGIILIIMCLLGEILEMIRRRNQLRSA